MYLLCHAHIDNPHLVLLHALQGGIRFVHISDPSVFEMVLRQEGKYPRREATLSSNLAWIIKKLDLENPIPFK